jgi:hypothetical protein
MSGTANSALRVGQPRPVEVGPDLKLLRDYIAGCLSDHDRLALEERMRHDPTLAEELEQLMRFREGLQVLHDEVYLRQPALRSKQPSAWRLKAWVPFLAAAALAGVALLLWQNRAGDGALLNASPGRASAGMPMPVARHLTFVAMRGEGPPDLDLPPDGLIDFRVSPGMAAPNSRFEFTLTRTDEDPSRTLGSLAGLTISAADGYIHAYVAASRLSPGNYVLRAEPAGTPAQAQAFSFSLHTH